MKMTNAEYHAAPGISKSGLDRIARSPAHYKAWLDSPPVPTREQIFGSAYHAMILEPDDYLKHFAIAPECDRRTKAGKEEWQAFEAAAAGRQAITREDQEILNSMAKALWSHDLAMKLLADGTAEDSLFADISGCKVKVRPDYKRPDVRVLIDLKTASDASISAFSRAVATYRYHVQAAFYLDVANQIEGDSIYQDFIFIVQEKAPPYAVAVYVADDSLVSRGRELYLEDLAVYARCLASDEWPGYPQTPTIITLPRWAQ